MSHSRPRTLAKSRSRASRDSRVFAPQNDASLLIPEGDVGTSTDDLLEVVDPQHALDPTLVDDLDDEPLEHRKGPKRPWYKTPSPWWYVRNAVV